MRSQRTPHKSKASNVVGASAAGGGIGTIIVAFANGMPVGAPYKSVLILSAPLLAVGISGLWLFVKAVYIDPYAERRKNAAADEAMEKILWDARANAEMVLNNPNSSDAHRKEVRKMVEDLERLRLEKISERMRVIATD
jgi:hypothetical protein